jgi:hypothetical protein
LATQHETESDDVMMWGAPRAVCGVVGARHQNPRGKNEFVAVAAEMAGSSES